jgi:hypothetical protein
MSIFKNSVAAWNEDFLDFWQGFGEGACPQWPVTEPKRSQKRKRPFQMATVFFKLL